MKRLYILIPDLKVTEATVLELKQYGIQDQNLHILGMRSDMLQKAHLHEANILQTSDFIPSLERGALIGLVCSFILCALYAYALPPEMKVKISVLLGIVVFSMIFGAWVSSLIGVSVKNPIVAKYKKYIKQGHYIMMVDADSEVEEKKIQEVILHHAGAKMVEQETRAL